MGKTEKNEPVAEAVPAPDESKIETSATTGREHLGKRFVILSILLVLLIAAGTYAYFRLAHPHHATPKHAVATKTAYDKANELALSGNESQAQASLDVELKVATTPTQKGAIYEQKAAVALSTNDYVSALKYAQQAETLHATRNSANLIAEAAELSGDKATAIKYYQIVITRTDPKIDDYTIPQLQNKIKALQA